MTPVARQQCSDELSLIKHVYIHSTNMLKVYGDIRHLLMARNSAILISDNLVKLTPFISLAGYP